MTISTLAPNKPSSILSLISLLMNNLHHPDIERCKKLSDLRFPRTQHWWCIWWDKCEKEWTILDNDDESASYTDWNVCPSVMELLDVMPYEVTFDKEEYYLDIRVSADFYTVSYTWCIECSDTLPNALCDLIFWLYDNKYITFPTHE